MDLSSGIVHMERVAFQSMIRVQIGGRVFPVDEAGFMTFKSQGFVIYTATLL